MANELYDFDSDSYSLDERTQLSSLEEKLIKDYVYEFEHYIGDIGNQADNIARIFTIPDMSFPKQVSKWKKHYIAPVSMSLYQAPDQPKVFVDWWRNISKPIDFNEYNLDREGGVLTGPRSLLINDWDELKDKDKDKIRISMQKINLYFEHYLARLNQLNIYSNRLAPTKLTSTYTNVGLNEGWNRLNEFHLSLNIEYPNLRDIIK
tara:strand:- start:48 stop:665 length:618 start_codon:yes stop_codon:yes gene_type:complete